MLLRVRVEHELRERAMQSSDSALHQHEPRARDLRRDIEIQHLEPGAEVYMVFYLVVVWARRPDFTNFLILAFGLAHGHARMRHVRNTRQEIIEVTLDGI